MLRLRTHILRIEMVEVENIQDVMLVKSNLGARIVQGPDPGRPVEGLSHRIWTESAVRNSVLGPDAGTESEAG